MGMRLSEQDTDTKRLTSTTHLTGETEISSQFLTVLSEVFPTTDTVNHTAF